MAQTLNQILKQLSNVADAHANINSFFEGEMYDFASSGLVRYPAMAVVKNPFIYDSNNLTYSFNIYIMDLVHKDASNRTEVLNDTLQICMDVLALLDRNFDVVGQINTKVTFNDFIDSFDQEVSGYWFELKIKVPYVLDECAVPASVLTVVEDLGSTTGAQDDSYPALNDNIVFASKFDNSVLDQVGSNNGTLVNDATYTTGKINKGVILDGVGDYVLFANDSWDYTTFSFAIWVKPTSVIATNACIVSNVTTSGGAPQGWEVFQVNKNIVFNTYRNGGQVSNVIATNALTAGTWTLVVVTRLAGTRSRVYIDGILAASDATTNNPNYHAGNKTPSVIGASTYTSPSTFNNNFNGVLDIPCAWNIELDATKISALYNNGTGRQYTF